MVFVRRVAGRSGSTKVQIAERRGGRDVVLEHVGTAHDEAELALLLAEAESPDDAPVSQSVPEGPLVVPVVEFTVDADGTMTVTIDGTPHTPEPFAPPWRRESFPAILDALTTRLQTPLRVHVREADGSAFTDIINPPRTRNTEHLAVSVTSLSPIAAPPVGTSPTAAIMPVVHQVAAEGFVPGEDVAVAIIHTHSDAGSDGTARALFTPEQLATSPTGEIILLGRISGTLVIGHPE